MFKVYRVTGKNTKHSYYGYTENDDVAGKFFAQSDCNDDRGDVRFIQDNGGVEGLTFEVIKECEHEMQAFLHRNFCRGSDPRSITGPSVYPATIYERAKKEDTTEVGKAFKIHQAATQPTARKAWKMGFYKTETIKHLANTWLMPDVVSDLDNLNPAQFSDKYGISHEASV